ncbi:hypothetical protein P4E94_15040 [Pontiellaceae bacterium B12219]|nr:hypothetical protein [Pontiellaceae bacterium B12219]
MRRNSIVFTTVLFILTASSTWAQFHKYDVWEENFTVSGLLGAVQYQNLKFTPPDSAEPAEVDLSLIPQVGGAWTTLPRGERFQYGLEATFLLGFRFDDVNYAYLGGGGAYISLSTSMWMFDLAGGPYMNLFLTKTDTVRIFAGAGPTMTFAMYQSDRTYSDSSTTESDDESAFGLGLYARAGIEFRVVEKGMLGMSVRGSWANLDFTEVGGSSNVDGIGLYASFTAGF